MYVIIFLYTLCVLHNQCNENVAVLSTSNDHSLFVLNPGVFFVIDAGAVSVDYIEMMTMTLMTIDALGLY